MFNCGKCDLLQEEVKFLRDEVRRLTDQLIAMSNPQAFNSLQFAPPSGEFYGSDTDEHVEYGQFGQKVIVTKKQ